MAPLTSAAAAAVVGPAVARPEPSHAAARGGTSDTAGFRWRSALFLALLGALCLGQALLHTGERSGFYQSSRPIHGENEFSSADGYVVWLDGTPVLGDSSWFVSLVEIFLGLRGPEGSGILDRRAGYAWTVSLLVPVLGYYPAFVAVNVLSWWGAAAAMWWLARRRTGDVRQAAVAALLVATGSGFTFAVGTPMSYVAGFALMMLLLALAERLRVFGDGSSFRSWVALGWAAGVAGLYYFAQIPFLLFLWTYGLVRARLSRLVLCTGVALLVSVAWEAYGRWVLGLGFATDNSGALGESVSLWLLHVRQGWAHLVETFRIAQVRGTVTGAFAYPVVALALLGLVRLPRRDSDWFLAIIMAGLVPAVMISALIPLPRSAYYMYPAVYLLAARAAIGTGTSAGRALGRLGIDRAAAVTPLVVGGLLVAAQAAVANADLAGVDVYNVWFHFSMRYGW